MKPDIILRTDLLVVPYNIPEDEPLVFDLFNEPTVIHEITTNTSEYYVRLFTDTFYINIHPNATYIIILKDDKVSPEHIVVDSKLFIHGIARKVISGLNYNVKIDGKYNRSVTNVERSVDYYIYDNDIFLSNDALQTMSPDKMIEHINRLNRILKKTFNKLLEHEQQHKNEIIDYNETVTTCKEKNKIKDNLNLTQSIYIIFLKIWFGFLVFIVMTAITYLYYRLKGKEDYVIFLQFLYVFLSFIVMITISYLLN